MRLRHLTWLPAVMPMLLATALGGDGNRLTFLDEFCDPYYVGLETPKLITPQWIGEDGVELAIVLSIDDLSNIDKYETFLRPVLTRLAKIDGRAPLSMMTLKVDTQDARLQEWLAEGVTLEPHTIDHPHPILQGGNLPKGKESYDRCVDLMASIPNARPVAYRMPYYDSKNTVSPRFYTEIFNKTTSGGNFLRIDSSIFSVLTADDPALPARLVKDEEGRPRFSKYIVPQRDFVNMVRNYPYPFVIARLCWQLPSIMPDDCVGKYLTDPAAPSTIRDMKAAIDAVAIKRGLYTLCFHPHGWIRDDQLIDLIDHATTKHAGKVKFLNFREVHQRITENLLGGQPLRAANGQDNGVRILDLNNDGFMDVAIGNENLRQTRLWSPKTGRWTTREFPVRLVTVDGQGARHDAGARFGVLRESGHASMLIRNQAAAGLWHFDGEGWVQDPCGLDGLELDGRPVFTAVEGRGRGVRLRDLDGDGVCELIVGNEKQQGVFRWSADGNPRWSRLAFALPRGTAIVDVRGRDAGLRLVDVDADEHPDVVFSNSRGYSVSLFASLDDGWSRAVLSGPRGDENEIPMIVRPDGTNNGAWFKYGRMFVQNEDTGGNLPNHIDSRRMTTLLGN
jgi:polysaccharide deacetylase